MSADWLAHGLAMLANTARPPSCPADSILLILYVPCTGQVLEVMHADNAKGGI